MKIRLSKSSISDKEISTVVKVLKKEYLGMGTEVKLFEEAIKNYKKAIHFSPAYTTAYFKLARTYLKMKD